ncbi:transcriptional regulator [Klebsiella pneumoniae]|nr:transcriptional regulator [Klebsiella pneumoniae]
MYFVLNKMIKFLPMTNELSVVNDAGSSVLLSRASTRLLEELVKNPAEILARELLLKSVWEDYGYTPSYNNLYIAVSELRKSFLNLGEVNNIIITVPKSGLQLDATIDIFEGEVFSSEAELTNLFSCEVAPSHFDSGRNVNIKTLTSEFQHSSTSKNNSFLIFLVKSIFLSFILFGGFMVYFYNKHEPFVVSDLNDSVFLRKDSCDIYLINANEGYDLQKVSFEINSKMEQYGVDCSSTKKNIYYQLSFPRLKVLEEATMAICVNDSKIKSCETIKEMAG